ncbi:dermatopontin-like [Physella acuta]|uniref:dermatopontin-like n=1 Tax=Physella acuta TaxID=109671 RepID=UPI0027DC2EBD|nr:dermatopontin-like [Physella acuta]
MCIFTYLALAVSMATMCDGFYVVNYWDQPFDFKCPLGQAISYISSEHSDYFEDRRWEFHCRPVGETRVCEESGYVNEFDQLLTYVCPDNKVMTGVSSYHSDYYEDRRFQFQCCSVTGRNLTGCYITGDVNTWDRQLTLFVPEGRVVNGAYSVHSDYYEDRIWRFNICSI